MPGMEPMNNQIVIPHVHTQEAPQSPDTRYTSTFDYLDQLTDEENETLPEFEGPSMDFEYGKVDSNIYSPTSLVNSDYQPEPYVADQPNNESPIHIYAPTLDMPDIIEPNEPDPTPMDLPSLSYPSMDTPNPESDPHIPELSVMDINEVLETHMDCGYSVPIIPDNVTMGDPSMPTLPEHSNDATPNSILDSYLEMMSDLDKTVSSTKPTKCENNATQTNMNTMDCATQTHPLDFIHQEKVEINRQICVIKGTTRPKEDNLGDDTTEDNIDVIVID